MSNIAIIPARSGSKGLKDKNILPLCGKPLLTYSIEAAIESRMFDEVMLSTDSERYAEIGREYGANVPFLRSAELASDTASSWDVVLDVLKRYRQSGQSFETVALLQPTSPLRTVSDICDAFCVKEKMKATAVVGVCEAEHSPLWCNTLGTDGSMKGFLSEAALHPRQRIPVYYRINGAIYLVSVDDLLRKRKIAYDEGCFAYIMPQERSVDIDGMTDFMVAEAIVKQNNIRGGGHVNKCSYFLRCAPFCGRRYAA